jgi:uncharacterized protein
MKKILFVLLALNVAFIIQGFSQNSSLLWEITGKGLEKPSFLYGTMHVKDKRVFQFGDSVLPNFNRCKTYAGEMIMEEMDPMAMMGMLMMPGDSTLEVLLTKKDYEFVKRYADKKLGAMGAMIDQVKPIFTAALLTEMTMQQDSSQSLDEYLQQLAEEKAMKVVGIESMEEQMDALNSISLKEQAQILLQAMQEGDKSANNFDKMMELYIKQDLDGLLKLMNDSEMTDIFNKSIILKRNYVMAERITKMIMSQSSFIGIGAAHLPGKEGVIELLRSKGYTVRPVFSK